MADPDDDPPLASGVPRPGGGARTVVFAVDGPIGPADVPVLCERVCSLMAPGDVEVVVCDVGAPVRADAVTLDALARLQLAARRRGCRVVLRNASSDLLALLELVGLSDIVPLHPDPPG